MGGHYATGGNCPKQPENIGLVCTNANCEKCGWNPAVAEKRREKKQKGGRSND